MLMNSTFHEDVSPVVHRTQAGIQVFIGLNVMRYVDKPEQVDWSTMPGKVPVGQNLVEQIAIDADIEPRDGD